MSEGDRRVDGDAIGGLEKEFVSFRAETAEICSSEHGWKPFMSILWLKYGENGLACGGVDGGRAYLRRLSAE